MWELFGLLVAIAVVCLLPIAFLGACALWLVQRGSAGDASSASTAAPTLGAILPSAGGVLLVALMLAVLYWFLSRRSAADRLIRVMHARPLDPGDRFHHQLSDIVEEMRVATGGPAVRCLTVPTRAMNAFTFSDLHGGACIGVTEGALSGLSRRQLQGVVAHEFGHVLSGDYVTATSACLLFGVYSSIRDSLEEGIDDGRAVYGLRAVLLHSCRRRRRSPTPPCRASASGRPMPRPRYTRDPLSLAQALQMMVRSPVAAATSPTACPPCASGRRTSPPTASSRVPWPPIRRSTTASSACSTSHMSAGTSSSNRMPRPKPSSSNANIRLGRPSPTTWPWPPGSLSSWRRRSPLLPRRPGSWRHRWRRRPPARPRPARRRGRRGRAGRDGVRVAAVRSSASTTKAPT